MYNYTSYPTLNNTSQIQNGSNDRLIGGGFAFPFLLGGVTGAALAPNFWGPRPYPVYGPGPMYGPGPYPIYGPRPYPYR